MNDDSPFWKGFFSVFNLFPDPELFDEGLEERLEKSDSERIRGDFKRIGKDFENVIRDLDKNKK